VRAAEGAALSTALVKPARSSRLLEAISAALDPEAAPRAARTPEPGPAPARTAPARTDGEARILVVDDNEVNRRLVGHLLDKLGYAWVAVENGERALEVLGGESFDVVLMDLEMPVMDGYEAMGEIRRGAAGRADVPVVALSAAAMLQDQRRALAAGADAHVAKPIDRDELREVLARLLSPADDTRGNGAGAVDRAIVERLRDIDGSGAVLDRLLRKFFDLAEERLGSMRAAAVGDDVDRVRRLAHDVGGAAANLGMVGVASVCTTLERDESLGTAAALEGVEKLEREVAAVRETLARDAFV
jgi:CheY-like chemotaxis protein/HPt (histidine-containing phosphotransfer) domain-containing protein